MKTKLKETSSQSRLEVRDGILCVVVETALDGGASKAGSPNMRQWFRVEEPDADPATWSPDVGSATSTLRRG